MTPDILPLVTVENDAQGVLRRPCADAVPSPETSMLLHAMVATLRATPGAIGLAAPQVGVPIRAFVMGSEEQGYLAVLNPTITNRSKIPQTSVEGCLSVPGKQVTRKRPSSVEVTAIDAEGNKCVFAAKGPAACVVCHEIDHLNGLLIT